MTRQPSAGTPPFYLQLLIYIITYYRLNNKRVMVLVPCVLLRNDKKVFFFH